MNLLYLFAGLVAILTLIISYTVGLEYYLRRKQERRTGERRTADRRTNTESWTGVERRMQDRRSTERRHIMTAGLA